MWLTHGANRAVSPAAAVTIGNFDGLHLGHQALIGRLRREAGNRGLISCVLTFEPHPREFFAPRSAPTRLTTLREKAELLRGLHAERLHVERFSRHLAGLEPQAFVEQVLVDRLNARWVLIGDDFRFGARRSGDVKLLAELGAHAGFEVAIGETVMHQGTRVSSSAVRAALAAGELATAQSLLGRPYSISGRVVHGDKLGRQLGFATANVQFRHNRPPLTGIFAVRVHGADAAVKPGVASLGVRPSVTASGRAVLEAHIFDFCADLYGRQLRIEFLHKLRDEEKFTDLEALRRQIARDCDAARSFLLGS